MRGHTQNAQSRLQPTQNSDAEASSKTETTSVDGAKPTTRESRARCRLLASDGAIVLILRAETIPLEPFSRFIALSENSLLLSLSAIFLRLDLNPKQRWLPIPLHRLRFLNRESPP